MSKTDSFWSKVWVSIFAGAVLLALASFAKEYFGTWHAVFAAVGQWLSYAWHVIVYPVPVPLVFVIPIALWILTRLYGALRPSSPLESPPPPEMTVDERRMLKALADRDGAPTGLMQLASLSSMRNMEAEIAINTLIVRGYADIVRDLMKGHLIHITPQGYQFAKEAGLITQQPYNPRGSNIF